MDFLKEFEISEETINVIKDNFSIEDQEEIINSLKDISSKLKPKDMDETITYRLDKLYSVQLYDYYDSHCYDPIRVFL